MSQRIAFWNRRSVRSQAQSIVATIIIFIGAFAVMVPFAWMVSTSLKPLGEVFISPIRWIPSEFHWENYANAIKRVNFGLYARNSTFVTGLSVLGNVVAASMVGFAFARLQAPGRDFWFTLLLGTLMLPTQVTLVSSYLIFRALGWLNSYKPLIVPAFCGSAFYIFLLRQFMMTVPVELDDAARIDGCGPVRLYWHIVLPLAKPALATVAIFSFFLHWNAFLQPIIYLTEMGKYTIPIGLRFFLGTEGAELTQWHYMMAGALLAMIPCLLIFFSFQRTFVRGAVLTGLKG